MQLLAFHAAAGDRENRSEAASFRAHPGQQSTRCPKLRQADVGWPASAHARSSQPHTHPAAAATPDAQDKVSRTRRSRVAHPLDHDREDDGRWKSKNRSFAFASGHRNQIDSFARLLVLAVDLQKGEGT